MSDRKLEGRMKVLEEGADEALGRAIEATELDPDPGTLVVAQVGLALALELRALRLAVLSRQPVKWWW